VPTPSSGGGLEIVLAQIGLGRLVFYHSPRSGCPEHMRLALDILEGQNFARKNHHRVGPCCAGAAELASVDALDGHCQSAQSRKRPSRGRSENSC
jgi:hypothetical protein